MPDGIGAAVLDDLPDDIVVGKILILLPPKDVGRCRVVRKSWRGATSTPEFVLEHRRRQPSLPIIDGGGGHSVFVVLRSAVAPSSGEDSTRLAWAAARATTVRFLQSLVWKVGLSMNFLGQKLFSLAAITSCPGSFRELAPPLAPSEHLWPFLTQCHKNFCQIHLHAACDGFLVVSRGLRLYVCNPTIRRHALLPFQKDSNDTYNICVNGFYQHQSTGEYRVLWSRWPMHRKVGDRTESTLYVLTLGDNESRSIPVILPTTSSPSLEQTYALNLEQTLGDNESSPTHHGSNLHWLSSMTPAGDIIVFDTEAESFRWMSSPTPGSFSKGLFNMEGTLSFFSDSSASRDVWVIQDYNAQIWAFKYGIDKSTIEAPLPPLPPGSTNRFADMVVLNKHELLIGFNGCRVLRCHTDGSSSQMVSTGDIQYAMMLTRHRLQESIMTVPCSDIQEEDEEFAFSTEQSHAFCS